MKFPWRIIGHQKTLERLEQDTQADHIAQSYLFCGPQEIGKFRLIKTFAQLLQCDHKNICRACDACRRVEKNIHHSTIVVDRLWVKDTDENIDEISKYSNFDQSHRKKGSKKTEQIGVDDVAVFTKPLWSKTEERFKVCLIRDIERMTEEAMNTFLKILEEPPEKTIFLMTVTHKESLLPTIISRTRIINTGLISNSILRKALEKEMPEVEEHMFQKILTLAQGRPERLLKLAHDRDFLKSQDVLFEKISALLGNKDIPEFFRFSEQTAKIENEHERKEFFDGLIHFLRTLLREKVAGRALHLGNKLTEKQLIALIEHTQLTQVQISKNVNKRMALENLFLSF